MPSSINITNTRSLISKHIIHHIYFGPFFLSQRKGLGLVKHQTFSLSTFGVTAASMTSNAYRNKINF